MAISPQAGDPIQGGGLVVRASEDAGLSGGNFGYIEVIFENRSPSWLRLSQLSLDFGRASHDQTVRVPLGGELEALRRSDFARSHAPPNDDDLALLSFLGLAGFVIGVATDSPELAVLGDAVTTGASVAYGFRQQQRILDAVGSGQALVPDTHLLAPGLVLPPGLATRRWVVIETRGDAAAVTSARLDYQLEDGVPRSARMHFRADSCGSAWQRRLCVRQGFGD